MRDAGRRNDTCELLLSSPRDTGTIVTERPSEVWASDHTLTATVDEGQLTVFVAVDHCTIECVGATTAADFAPTRRRASAIEHDHGSQYIRDDYQAEIAFLGMESSPFVRQLECDGCIERFIRTLKEQLRWVAVFQNVEQLLRALAEFRER